MSTENIPAVGIDLGTTYSVISKLDNMGRPITLVNAEGDLTTPSVALFEGNEAIVGKEALKAMAIEPMVVAECAKRDIGHKVFHKVLENKQYPPEVIEALVLNKLRRDAIPQIGYFTKVVITVPAYFDEVRRKATQDAGYMAGLEVMDIINEPTAAAVAYGYQQGFLGQGYDQPRNVMVYDLGGGTFDVTIMRIEGNEFIALATDGDVQLGGYDWDQRLLDLTVDGFIREHYIDPREDEVARGRLWRECEDAKRTLTSRQKCTINCEYKGKFSRVEITREQFEQATLDLVDRTRFTAEQTLRTAGLEWSEVDRVLLVGGSSRMPMIRNMLQQISGKVPDAGVAADEAVAQGAALHAGLILEQSRGNAGSFHIRNVNSHSLGVIGKDPQTGRRRNGIIVPRNTQLPVTARRIFKTSKQNQKSVMVQVVEGESQSADDCTYIGQCSVTGLPSNLAPGTPIEVLFDYDPSGRLRVRVTVGGRQVETEFTRENTLSKEHLDGWRSFISQEAPTDYR